jgi:hypothetical protein
MEEMIEAMDTPLYWVNIKIRFVSTTGAMPTAVQVLVRLKGRPLMQYAEKVVNRPVAICNGGQAHA